MKDSTELRTTIARSVGNVVAAEYPHTTIELTHQEGLEASIVWFTPSNENGVDVSLLVFRDGSFDLNAGRFKLLESEPMADTETAQVSQIAGEILRLARDGLRVGILDRLARLGRDRIAPWQQ